MPKVNLHDDLVKNEIEESSNVVNNTENGSDAVENGHIVTHNYNDPNRIPFHIEDTRTPIVVLFGPPACGKTMMLVRLIRFLRKERYTVQPVRTFRDTEDTQYSELCDNFDELINKDEAAVSTDKLNFMLIKVFKNAKPICQFLEAPGEFYFEPQTPMKPTSRLLGGIINSPNRKIWMVMLEPNWKNRQNRLDYVGRIGRFVINDLANVRRKKFIVVFNKIDKLTEVVNDNGRPRLASVIDNVKQSYEGVFDIFRNTTPIVSLFKPYNCDFIMFKSGDYYQTSDNRYSYLESSDYYPKKMWKLIIKLIRG